MANRYWVGGTASWDGTAGTKWALTSGGAGGQAVPTSADDVFFDAASGVGTVTIAAGNTGAKSINCTGFTGTLSFGAAITVAGSVTFVSGMTRTGNGRVTFTATATLITAGKGIGAFTVNAPGGTVGLGDACSCSAPLAGPIITAGTFNTNDFNLTAQVMTLNGTATRTINLGSSTVTCDSSYTVWDASTTTNLTFNAGTSTISFTATPQTGGQLFEGGGLTYYNVSFSQTGYSGNNRTINGANTFNNLTISGPTTGVDAAVTSFNAGQTINGTLTCSGNSPIRRIYILSNTFQTTRTFTVGTLVATDCDFRDITIAGGAAGTSQTRAGDVGGNSGIGFPAAKTVYWNLAAGGNWTATGWAASSGDAPNINNFPLAQDTAIVEATGLNSGATITLNARDWAVGSVDLSARTTNTMTFTSTGGLTVIKDIKLGTGVTVSGTGGFSFIGRTTQNFTSAGVNISFPITIDGSSTSFKLLTNNLTSTNSVTLTQGTLDLNNLALTSTTFSSTNSNSRTLAFGTGNITVTSTGTVWNTATATNLTVTGTPVVNVTNATATATTVSPGSPTETNSISFNFTAGTYALTLSAGQVLSLNFTGFSGTLSNNARTIYGNFTASTGMTLTAGSSTQAFASTSGTARTINSAGKTFDFPVTFSGVGGTWQLVTNGLTMGATRTLTHTNGTLDLNGLTLTVGTAYTTAIGTKNLTFNGGTLVCPAATTTAFNNAQPTNFSTTAGTGTGKISMTAAAAKTFVGGGSTYNCTLNNNGAGALTITGSNTFTTIANGVSPTTFTFTAGTTTTVTNWNVSGTAGNLITINSATAAAHTLSKASGTVSADYLSITNSTATGGATWYAGANSTDVSGNTGWIFTAPPSGNLAGALTVTFSTTAVAAGTGKLSGASDITATLSGTLVGAGVLTGSSNPTFSTTGTATSTAALVGSSDVTFSTSATATGAGKLVGSSDPAFTASATAAGAGKLVGSSDAAFTVSGTLAGAGGNLSGSTTVTFSTSGTVVGAGKLAGSSDVTFTISAAAVGAGKLVGSSDAAFSLSGTLNAVAGNLAGSVTVTFTTDSTLSATASAVGSTDLTFTATATPFAPTPPTPTPTPSRNVGGTLYALPMEDPLDKVRERDDRELVEIVSILMTMGVFHGDVC